MSVRQVDLASRWGVTRQAVSAMVRDGMPLGTVEQADAWRMANRGWNGGKKFSSLSCVPAGGVAPGAAGGDAVAHPGTGGMLARAEQAELGAFEAYRKLAAVVPQDLLEVSKALEAWKRAVALTHEARDAHRAAQVKDGVLAPFALVEETVRDALRPVLAWLKSMPATLGAKVNPADPAHAERELDAARARLFDEVRKVMGRVSARKELP